MGLNVPVPDPLCVSVAVTLLVIETLGVPDAVAHTEIDGVGDALVVDVALAVALAVLLGVGVGVTVAAPVPLPVPLVVAVLDGLAPALSDPEIVDVPDAVTVCVVVGEPVAVPLIVPLCETLDDCDGVTVPVPDTVAVFDALAPGLRGGVGDAESDTLSVSVDVADGVAVPVCVGDAVRDPVGVPE